MAVNEEVIAPTSPGTLTGSPGELVLQNGRLSGARRPLAAPLTLIGHADGCHIRLSLPGVSAFHCALVAGTDGLTLEDLKSQTGTLVNGEPVTTRVLKTGDLLSIGPCRFRVRLGSIALAPAEAVSSAMQRPGTDAEAMGREKDALRVQAAAVAAQQIALLEKERRLQQSKVALEQQESQLASHLEEKRQRLAEFRDQCQEARGTLKQERAAHEQVVAQRSRELELARAEVVDSQRQVNVERRRLLMLRQRLKQRLHRHWQAERASIGRREALLARASRSLEKRINLLEVQKQASSKDRLRLNGEIELSRRQLQATQEGFRQTQLQWEASRTQQRLKMQEQASGLEDRAAALAEAEQELALQQARWNKRRLKLEKEVEGLENRINNSRRRLGALQVSGGPDVDANEAEAQHSPVAGSQTRSNVAPSDAVTFTPSNPGVEGEYERRLATLDAIAGELADQRLHLVEECERFLRAQQNWRQDHDVAAAELETLARSLERREQGILQAEEENRRRAEEAQQTSRQLEGRRAELTLRTATWEGERDRWAAELRSREEGVERRLAALADLRRQWTERRHQEVTRLHEEFNALKQLKEEWATLRAEWVREHARIADRQRDLAERALALEQYKQQYVVAAGHPAAAEKQIQQLRRTWTDASAAARQELANDRKALDFQMSRLQELFRRTRKLAGEVAVRAAHQSERETAEEHKEVLAASDSAKIRQEVRSLRAHRAVSEREIAALRDEVERLARMLIDESPNASSHAAQQAA
jgi:chromosome segregation ATPase